MPPHTIDDILAEVRRQRTLGASTRTLFALLQARILELLAGDPATQAKVEAAFTEVLANNDDLAAAIVENTPAAPPPVGP